MCRVPPAPVLKSYTISEEDVAGPFERQIPRPLEQMAKLHGLTYKSPLEELSEKFHMSENLLRTLNPGADFDIQAGFTMVHPGTIVKCDDQDFACRTARVQMKFARRRENPCNPDKNREAGEAAEEVA